jgi:RND family efflux transporter MFP subunit
MTNPDRSTVSLYISPLFKARRLLLVCAIASALGLASCGNGSKSVAEASSANTSTDAVKVGVVPLGRQSLQRDLTVSSELVPFQEIDVYAKEAGYIRKIFVDYGSHVKAGQTLATLEIPELQLQLQADDAATERTKDQVSTAQHQLNSVQAQHKNLHLQFERLSGVAKTRPGLIAQQELDDAESKDLASDAQEQAAKSNLDAANSGLSESQAKRQHDQALFDYATITAPFAGVITQRYANLGALIQAGTSSSTQAMPLVKLSEDDKFRLVIPVPESYVPAIHLGDPVRVVVPALNKTIEGKVSRFSVDVKEDTRTMHTEVDVPNTSGNLVPGLYAEATFSVAKKNDALAVPLQAVNRTGTQTTVDVVGKDNKIEVRNVTLGIQTDSYAEVLSGLQEGDQIVVSDRAALKPGQLVQPATAELMEYKDPQGKE